MNAQKGFTLIELMIVVAIIGILAAIAIPQYQNYVTKSQATRLVGELGNIKTLVDLCLTDGNECAFALPESSLLGAEAASDNLYTGTNGTGGTTASKGKPVVTIKADGGATIAGTFSVGSSAVLKGKTIQWHRNNASHATAPGTWACETTITDTKFIPSGCASKTALTAAGSNRT